MPRGTLPGGATNGQVLTFNSTSGKAEWADLEGSDPTPSLTESANYLDSAKPLSFTTNVGANPSYGISRPAVNYMRYISPTYHQWRYSGGTAMTLAGGTGLRVGDHNIAQAQLDVIDSTKAQMRLRYGYTTFADFTVDVNEVLTVAVDAVKFDGTKFGFFNLAPSAQQTIAADLTDSSTGSVVTTLPAVADSNTSDCIATLWDRIKSLEDKIETSTLMAKS